MKKKFCTTCGLETWHNQRVKKDKAEAEYRCIKCGEPRKSNIGQMNTGTKLKIYQYPY